MRRLVIGAVFAIAVGLFAMLSTSAEVSAGGPSEAQLANAGWVCGPPAGPPGHCFPPGEVFGSPTITVMVFEGGHFAGTEILWRADIYAGQPCPLDEVLDLSGEGLPYFACHHFEFEE
jgi:hypothetical protein